MHNLANTLILVTGGLWFIETLPQIWHLIKTKKTEGISLLFFLICASAYVIFLIGNIMLKNWSVVIANILPFFNLLIINFLIIKYRRQK